MMIAKKKYTNLVVVVKSWSSDTYATKKNDKLNLFRQQEISAFLQ